MDVLYDKAEYNRVKRGGGTFYLIGANLQGIPLTRQHVKKQVTTAELDRRDWGRLIDGPGTYDENCDDCCAVLYVAPGETLDQALRLCSSPEA